MLKVTPDVPSISSIKPPIDEEEWFADVVGVGVVVVVVEVPIAVPLEEIGLFEEESKVGAGQSRMLRTCQDELRLCAEVILNG